MKQAVLAVGLLIVLVFVFSGGFSVKDQAYKPSPTPRIASLVGEGGETDNKETLQLRDLKFGQPTTPPTSTPSPTPPTNNCTSKVAVNFLLDVSGSMDVEETAPVGQRKIDYLKSAMTSFGTRLATSSLVGIQVFSSATYLISDPSVRSMCYPNATCEILPIGSFNSDQYQQQIASLRGVGATQMKDGFQLSKQKIDAFRVNNPQYNDYEWFFVFLSDGLPVPALTQWPFPRGPQQPLDVVTPIKNLPNTKIISIGLGSPGDDYDQGLMAQIASSPQYFHGSLTGNDLGDTFQQIFSQVCE